MNRPLHIAIPCGVEPSFLNFLFLALSFLALLLGAGCSSRDIEGRVADPFGNGLADVTVQVQKTTFRATSGRDGHYALDYVPGTFAVEFVKPGYTTQTLELAIQQKMRFPAETVILYPIPSNPGLYYLGDRELVLLPRSTVRVSRIEGEWNKPSEERYYIEGEPSQLAIPAGRARFIDTVPRQIVMVKANHANMIVHLLKRFGIPEYRYDGSRADESVKTGREQLLIRTVQLDPGTYAWIEVAPIDPILGGLKPNEKQPSYAFKVQAPAHIKKELEKLLGTWTIVSSSTDGKSHEEQNGTKAVFADDKVTFTPKEGKPMTWTYELDPTIWPRTMDLMDVEGDTIVKGIYELEGDTYKACVALPGKERPQHFTSPPGSGHTLFVLVREKP